MAQTPDDARDDELASADAAEVRAAVRGAYGRHLAPDVLRAAAADVLPLEARADVEAHLLSCVACRGLARDLEQLDGEADADAWSEADDQADRDVRDRVWARVDQRRGAAVRPHPRWWNGMVPVWLAAAAGLALVVVMQLRTGPAPVTTPLPASAPTATALSPSPTSATAFRLPLEAPAVTVTSAALTMRAPGADPQAFLKALAPGFDAYRAGRFADAARLLAPVATAYPRAIEPAFHLGVSLLLAGDAAAAVPILERADAQDHDALDDAVRWFLAVARERAGNAAQAAADVALLCKDGTGTAETGSYRQRACDASK